MFRFKLWSTYCTFTTYVQLHCLYIYKTGYTEPESKVDGEELRLNMLGEGFAWIGGSYKPVKLDQCDGYSDNFDYLTIWLHWICLCNFFNICDCFFVTWHWSIDWWIEWFFRKLPWRVPRGRHWLSLPAYLGKIGLEGRPPETEGGSKQIKINKCILSTFSVCIINIHRQPFLW